MLHRYMSRRNLIYRFAGFLLTLSASKGLAQDRWLAGMRLDISFEYVGGAGRYKAPYVAVWIENAQGVPVRTLALWYKQSKKGTKWLPDLRRWYRNGSLEDTVSGPTRIPGRYSLSFDGKDDKGNWVSQGDYFVCVEMVREDGPYQLFREKISLAQSPFKRSYNLNGELREVVLNYAQQS